MLVEFESPNPFGAITEADVYSFERKISLTLPADYRTYLIALNGALPKNRYFRTSVEPDVFYELEELNVLNGGPEYCNLNSGWRFAAAYDLGEYADDTYHLIAIGSALGCAVLLDTISGAVMLYEPDHEQFDTSQDLLGHLA